jgi:hypothetical protein
MRPGLALTSVRRLLLVVGVAFAVLPVGSALGDTTIGQVGGQFNPNFSAVCSGVLGDTNYVVPPGGGTIDSFSVQTGPAIDGTQAGFLVLRPAGGDNYEVVGQGPIVTLGGTGTKSFPADVPVQGGDILGLSLVPATSEPNFCVRVADSGPGGIVLSPNPNVSPSPGQTLSLIAPQNVRLDLNEAAHLVTDGSGSPPPPTSKDLCKNGGWRNLPQFKNQGGCVSFVATGGKNPPSGS